VRRAVAVEPAGQVRGEGPLPTGGAVTSLGMASTSFRFAEYGTRRTPRVGQHPRSTGATTPRYVPRRTRHQAPAPGGPRLIAENGHERGLADDDAGQTAANEGGQKQLPTPSNPEGTAARRTPQIVFEGAARPRDSIWRSVSLRATASTFSPGHSAGLGMETKPFR